MTKKIKYSKIKLKKFRKTILERMENVSREMGEMKNGVLNIDSSKARMSPDSIYSVHMNGKRVFYFSLGRIVITEILKMHLKELIQKPLVCVRFVES